MKTEFSLSKEVAYKLAKMLSQPGVESVINYRNGFCTFSSQEVKCYLKHDLADVFMFHTVEVDLMCSILKNSNEWNFSKTSMSSFTLNGIKFACKSIDGEIENPLDEDYLLSMTREEFDHNFSLFEHTRISRVINNQISGISFIFGNKTIKLCVLDYASIATSNIQGDINEAAVNNIFKHDSISATFKEDDINFIKELINPSMKIKLIFYHGKMYFVNDKIWFNVAHASRPQTIEKMKNYDSLFKQAVKVTSLDKSSIFDVLHMISDCQAFESLIINFSKGLISLSSNGCDIAKIKDKKIDIEAECEINLHSLYLILNKLSPSGIITLKKVTVDPDVYYVIENNENDCSFLLIG